MLFLVHVTSLAFNFIQMSMPEDQLKKGKCLACNASCFIECLYCYCLLEHRGKEHNCPVAQVNKLEGVPDYYEVCRRCELFLRVILLDVRRQRFGEL